MEPPHPYPLELNGMRSQFFPSASKTLIDLPVVFPGARPAILCQHSLYFLAISMQISSSGVFLFLEAKA